MTLPGINRVTQLDLKFSLVVSVRSDERDA